MALPAVGTSSYGSYSFPSNAETVEFNRRPMYDRTGRVVTYTEISIAIRFIVNLEGTSPGTTDTSVLAIVRELTAPARPFIYSDKGLGDVRVNVPGEPS